MFATLHDYDLDSLTRSTLSDSPWDMSREFDGATLDEIARAAALVRGSDALLLHHCRDGRLNWRGLATSMARCLTEPLNCSHRDRDALYDHLAAHYAALGVEPPEAGLIDDDRAYELALEGRIAHLDDDGDAWLFAEAVEVVGDTVPGFASVDGKRLKLCVCPRSGLYSSPEKWGRLTHAFTRQDSWNEIAARVLNDNDRRFVEPSNRPMLHERYHLLNLESCRR